MLRTSVRGMYCAIKQVHRNSSSATPALPSVKHGTTEDTNSGTSSSGDEISVSNYNVIVEEKRKSSMVAAAFASLKKFPEVIKPTVEERILKCKTPEELLTISQKFDINRKQALKIVTTLSEWSVNGSADMSKFETDPRFVSLCQLLGRTSTKVSPSTSFSKQSFQEKQGDLSLVLDISANDEAMKIACSLSLPQIIKVLSSLAAQKKRSLPLLKTLAHNIADSKNLIDIKKCADILYALSVLNFPDEVLLQKLSHDLIETIPVCEKPAVIGSICTSLGKIRYRDDSLLDCLSEWVIENRKICRNQDLVSVLITLAIVNHMPISGFKFFDILTSQLTADDIPNASAWLNVVWSLVTFEKASSEHYRSVLSQRFLQRILSTNSENSNVVWKKKLLNINGSAKFNTDYKGPILEENKDIDISIVPMVRNKEKQALVNSVLDAFSNILPSAAYLRINIDSGMGFLIDGECRFDGKMTPYPLVDKKTGQAIIYKPGKGQKIAIMCWDYHDYTRGKMGLSGINAFTIELLNKAGYRVLSVHYKDYNTKDKLSERIQYIEENLKSTIKPNS